MKELKIIRYDDSFFNENEALYQDSKNTEFWSALHELQSKFLNSQITVRLFPEDIRGHFYERAEIICTPKSLLVAAQSIHYKYYYSARLKLYPEFEGKEADVMESLLKERHNE